MSEDQMRAEFEEWVSEFMDDVTLDQFVAARAMQGDESVYLFDDDVDSTMVVTAMWVAWKASRKALCVSLPKPFGSSTMCNDFLTYGEVTKALDKAGVAYK